MLQDNIMTLGPLLGLLLKSYNVFRVKLKIIMGIAIQEIYEGFLNLLYEPSCPFGLEHSCSPENVCTADGWSSKVCGFCLNELVDLKLAVREDITNLPVYSAALYLEDAKKINHKFKWVEPKLARPIAELINYKLLNAGITLDFDYLVPVPGLPSEDRDWIPSLLLAKELGNLLKIPVLSDALVKTGETRLYKLGKQQRFEAVSNFYARNSCAETTAELDSEPRKIFLIDDLIASGATLMSCANQLWQGNLGHKITGVTFTCVLG
jgi:predicted amidophosphoribosyltransferase